MSKLDHPKSDVKRATSFHVPDGILTEVSAVTGQADFAVDTLAEMLHLGWKIESCVLAGSVDPQKFTWTLSRKKPLDSSCMVES